MTPELIEHLNEQNGNNPQVVKSSIINDTLLIPDPVQLGKKIRVSKFIFQISIHETHIYLIPESIFYQLKEATNKTTSKTPISDTSLRALIPKNVRKMTDRHKEICG